MENESVLQVKSRARQMQERLLALGQDVGYRHLLEAMAAAESFRDWNHYHAHLTKTPSGQRIRASAMAATASEQAGLPPQKLSLGGWHGLLALPLGVEHPLSDDRVHLIELFTRLTMPNERGQPYVGAAGLAELLVDELYRTHANATRSAPSPYHAAVCVAVDDALRQHRLALPEDPCWHDVRDVLFDAGLIEEAYLAHGFAQPTFTDASSVLRSPVIRDVYGRATIHGESSETLPEAFSRSLQYVCSHYEVHVEHREGDSVTGAVNVVNSGDIPRRGGSAISRRSNVRLAVVSYLATKPHTLSIGDLRDIPERYQDYHYARLKGRRAP